METISLVSESHLQLAAAAAATAAAGFVLSSQAVNITPKNDRTYPA